MRYFVYLLVLTHTTLSFAVEAGYEAVRSAVFSAPYDELPRFEVNKKRFGPADGGDRNLLLADAKRTLSSSADFADFGQDHKLFQPNGICFSGRWIIDRPSPFTGLFSQGSDIPAIARASVMLSGTTRGEKRALGLGVKLFAPGETESINVLVMESMGGRVLQHVTNAVLDNHPGLGSIPKIADLGTLLRIRKDLKQALKQTAVDGIDLRYLPLEHVSAVGVPATQQVVSPRWLRLAVPTHIPRVDADDFRDELRTHHYPGHQLVYELSVAADNGRSKRSATWQTIGKLVLDESVTSATCDLKLHFRHHGATR